MWARDLIYRDALCVAWHNAMLQRAQRLPALKDILPPPIGEDGTRRRRKQFDTPQQEWAMWEAIAVAANANLEERKRRGLVD